MENWNIFHLASKDGKFPDVLNDLYKIPFFFFFAETFLYILNYWMRLERIAGKNIQGAKGSPSLEVVILNIQTLPLPLHPQKDNH